MLGIISSKEDVASVNIANILLEKYEWHDEGCCYLNGNRILYIIEDEHLYHDNVDMELKEYGFDVETIIFASRHSSKKEMETLSVHPIGNFGKAEYGGKDRMLVKTNPLLMRNALELLKEKNSIGYKVSYEATHHGPWLSTPTFFIEVGSTIKEWNNMEACEIIADVIMEMEERKYKVAIGIGGGHYAPRFTDIALKNGVAFGHIASKYNVDFLNEEMLRKMIEATPDCREAYFHGNYGEIESMVRKLLNAE